MRKKHLIAQALLLASACCVECHRCLADGIFLQFDLKTSPLISEPAAPFSLSFQLTDGSGLGDANNTATLSNFVFGGFGVGGPAGTPTLTGSVSGDLSSGLTLVDSEFLNVFTQPFTPGQELSFILNLTTNLDVGGTPDQFSFSILDGTGTELPTLGGPFFNVFAAINIDSESPTVQTFGSDPSQTPAAGGPALDIGPPVVTNAVPEPGLLAAVSLGLGILLIRQRFGRTGPRP